MNTFTSVSQQVIQTVLHWEEKLLQLSPPIIEDKYNTQNRNIKMITGHMIDSATNNTHRLVHLQYQENPLIYPDYANFGNNDRWIAIQNYKDEPWDLLVQLWKYANLHYAYIVKFVNPEKEDCYWITATDEKVTLKEMILDYPAHLSLHMVEIQELINKQ